MSVIDTPEVPVREVVDSNEKIDKVEKIPFRDEQSPKLDTPNVPEGFNPKIHKSLGRGDFSTDLVYLEFKALECDARAKQYRDEIETLKKLGSASDRSKAKKLLTMQQRMAELARELMQEGNVDLKSILGEEQAAALLGFHE